MKIAFQALLMDWKKVETTIWNPTTGSMTYASRSPRAEISINPGSVVKARTRSRGISSQATKPTTMISVAIRIVSLSTSFIRLSFWAP